MAMAALVSTTRCSQSGVGAAVVNKRRVVDDRGSWLRAVCCPDGMFVLWWLITGHGLSGSFVSWHRSRWWRGGVAVVVGTTAVD